MGDFSRGHFGVWGVKRLLPPYRSCSGTWVYHVYTWYQKTATWKCVNVDNMIGEMVTEEVSLRGVPRWGSSREIDRRTHHSFIIGTSTHVCVPICLKKEYDGWFLPFLKYHQRYTTLEEKKTRWMFWVNPKTVHQIYSAKNILDRVLPKEVPASLVSTSAASPL